MSRLFWQISTTLDGFFEGPNKELADTAEFADRDFDGYASEMLDSIDAILLGRKTYQLFASYWPSATGHDADRLNQLPKYVVSRTLDHLEWSNSKLIAENIAEEVARLKRQVGRDIALFGSANLASTLIRHGLIDEYRIIVTPVLVGEGTPTFREIQGRIRLKLLKANAWSSGTVAFYYLAENTL